MPRCSGRAIAASFVTRKRGRGSAERLARTPHCSLGGKWTMRNSLKWVDCFFQPHHAACPHVRGASVRVAQPCPPPTPCYLADCLELAMNPVLVQYIGPDFAPLGLGAIVCGHIYRSSVDQFNLPPGRFFVHEHGKDAPGGKDNKLRD